ncbi:MAG: CoA-binding protein [Thermoleophilia bacterium]|nr:CoA-binding protein [Thermoleophilia bacterium]
MASLEDRIESIIAGTRVIAVVGASPNPGRPSHMVMSYLIENGFQVIPIRPKVKEILGRTCYENLVEVPLSVDVVDVFRKPEACPGIARAAVAIGAKTLWLQEGIVSDDAARIAREGGLQVVMNQCIKKVHQEMKP